MAVKIKRQGDTPQLATEPDDEIDEHIVVNNTQFKRTEVNSFGRLRMSQKSIADFMEVTLHTVNRAFERADVKRWYGRGKAEGQVSTRQQIFNAAAKGDMRAMSLALELFGDVTDVGDREELDTRSKYDWEVAVEVNFRDVREKMQKTKKKTVKKTTKKK